MAASNEALEQEVKDLRQDVAALRKALREEATRRTKPAAENVERLRTAAADAGSKAQAGFEQLEKQIEENPVQSAIAALLIGFLIGRLLGR